MTQHTFLYLFAHVPAVLIYTLCVVVPRFIWWGRKHGESPPKHELALDALAVIFCLVHFLFAFYR